MNKVNIAPPFAGPAVEPFREQHRSEIEDFGGPIHINALPVQTAEAIAAVELRRDRFHRRIAVAADYLVKQERGNLRYGGQYQDGTTIWMNERGEGEIVTPPQEVTLWIV